MRRKQLVRPLVTALFGVLGAQIVIGQISNEMSERQPTSESQQDSIALARREWMLLLDRYAKTRTFEDVCTTNVLLFGIATPAATALVFGEGPEFLLVVTVAGKPVLRFFHQGDSSWTWTDKNGWSRESSRASLLASAYGGTALIFGGSYWSLTALLPHNFGSSPSLKDFEVLKAAPKNRKGKLAREFVGKLAGEDVTIGVDPDTGFVKSVVPLQTTTFRIGETNCKQRPSALGRVSEAIRQEKIISGWSDASGSNTT
jgi:hypothetical protein